MWVLDQKFTFFWTVHPQCDNFGLSPLKLFLCNLRPFSVVGKQNKISLNPLRPLLEDLLLCIIYMSLTLLEYLTFINELFLITNVYLCFSDREKLTEF